MHWIPSVLLGCTLDTYGYTDGPTSTGEPSTAGSGSTDVPTGAGTTGELPDAPTLGLNLSQVKHFDFSWAPVAADHFQLMEKQNADQGEFTQVGGDIDGQELGLSLTVPLHFRTNASYLLRACSITNECTDSNVVPVSGTLAPAVGYFKASNTGADSFGHALALSADGKTLAVGAPDEDSGSREINGDQNNGKAADSGAIYVFTLDGDEWTQQAYIKAFDTAQSDSFGISLALSANGDTLAAGAYREDSGSADDESDASVLEAGAVYMFKRAGEKWSQQAYLKAPNPDVFDRFGGSVALSGDGDTLAVGAIGEDSASKMIGGDPEDDSADAAGAVYVFTRAGEEWSSPVYIKASNTDPEDAFGTAVALTHDGNVLAVGAPVEDGNGTVPDNNLADGAGAAYVFVRSDETWKQAEYLKAADPGSGDSFGISLALSADGSTLAVGAPDEDSNEFGVDDGLSGGAGAVYVFTLTGKLWAPADYLKAAKAAEGDHFGRTLALTGDGRFLAVGAVDQASSAVGVGGLEADAAAEGSGAVYLFTRADGDEAQWSQQMFLKAANTDAGDRFGSSVALSDDGETVAVGAEKEASKAAGISGSQTDNTEPNAGAVYLY